MVLISDRAADLTVAGHWEGGPITGKSYE